MTLNPCKTGIDWHPFYFQLMSRCPWLATWGRGLLHCANGVHRSLPEPVHC